MATNDTAGQAGTHRANGSSGPDTAPTEDTSPEVAALQADIERARADLADTVDQLTAKLDVKSRVRNRANETKDNVTLRLRKLQSQATDADGKPTPATLGMSAGVLAAAGAFLVVVLWRRNNSPRHTRKRRR